MITRPSLVGIVLIFCLDATLGHGQDWQQDDSIFNPSGIPSLGFSQPRLADLDADDDYDLILGSIDDAPMYFQNVGNVNNPTFQAGAEIFAPVDPLEAELGVCVDLDADGDLDFVCGGFTGLHLYDNIGNAAEPEFQSITGFFAGLAVGTNPVPALVDLDGDEDFDLLIGLSENGELKLYPNTGTPEAAQFLEINAETWFDVGLFAYPWFSDLDGDLDFDLLVGRDGPGFYFYRNIGDVNTWQWQADHAVFAGLAEASFWNSPCLIDLTGDGLQDLVFGTAAGPLQYFVNTGSAAVPVWTANTSLFGGVLDVGGASSPVFFDFDLDGDLDLASGSQLGNIKYFENVGTSFAPAWQANHDLFTSIDHSIYAAITLGDVDADGLPDAVAGDLSGNLFFHHNTGSGLVYDSSVFAGVNLGGWSVPRLVDMDGDDDLDIVAGNEAGALIYFENMGDVTTPDWAEVIGYFGGIDVGTNCVPTLGDFDHDNDQDLMTGNLFNEVRFFENMEGAWVEDPGVVDGITAGQNAAPALADLDGDGDLDLTIGNYAGTFNYYENINVVTQVSLREVPPRDSHIMSVYPNPFNPRVTVAFKLYEAGPVVLAVHDVMGRMVVRLVDEIRSAGLAMVTWDGRDDAGASVASGVYFARLQTLSGVHTHKLVLAR